MILSCAFPRAIHFRRLSSFSHSHRESVYDSVHGKFTVNRHIHTDSMSSNPSGGFFVLVVRILGMDARGLQKSCRATLIPKVAYKTRFRRSPSNLFKLMSSNAQLLVAIR